MGHPGIEDEVGLVRRLRYGDRAALAAFSASFLDRVYAFIYYRAAGDRQTAEDVTQETFLAAIDAVDRFDSRAGLYTWLCGIARHKLSDHYRRLRRLEQARAVLAHEPDLEPGPAEELEREERRRRVLEVLRTLPPHYRQALTLKYIDGLSGRELAAQLSLSEDGAESLLARARSAFRRAFTADELGRVKDQIHEEA